MKLTDRPTHSYLSIWSEMIPLVDHLLDDDTHIVYPGKSDPYYQWFVELEAGAFRAELRYSAEELEERLLNDDLLFLFLVSQKGREAVILAYQDPDNPRSSFYLDTIAVRTTGRGLGKILMRTLMQYARAKSYQRLRLDTETVNEKGQELVRFYKKLGFETADTTEDGNISMELHL